MTCDTWWAVNILSKFQLPISYGLGVKVFWRYIHKGWATYWINEWINDKGVCRTAPATPGLLTIWHNNSSSQLFSCMGLDVFLQVIWCWETLVTSCADKWLFSCMGTTVSFEMVWQGESPVTLVASKWFLSCGRCCVYSGNIHWRTSLRFISEPEPEQSAWKFYIRAWVQALGLK